MVTRRTAPGGRELGAEASLPVVARWTGTWLSGRPDQGDDAAAPAPPGVRLGLPPQGPGAVASVGARLLAFAADVVIGIAIGGLVVLFLGDVTPQQRSLANNGAFALQMVVLQALTGQSIGMRLLGIRVARLRERDVPPGFLPVATRTALIFLVLPAVTLDRDGRGWHDKAAGTVVLRAAGSRSFAG